MTWEFCSVRDGLMNLNNVVTNYTYGDSWGNLTQVVQDPGTGHLNRTTSMVYDSGGRVTSSTDPMGRGSTFSYNTLGQPTQASFPSTTNTPAESVSYSYGGNGRMNSVTDNRGTTSLAYETGNDRVSSVTDPITGAVGYTYGLSGERHTMGLPGGGTWTYDYSTTATTHVGEVLTKDDPNSLGKMLVTITDDGGRIADYHMDIRGQIHECFWNQVFDQYGAKQSYCRTSYVNEDDGSVHGHGWLKKIKNVYRYKSNPYYPTFNTTVLTQNDYAYNDAGMRTANQISDVSGIVRTETYGYDDVYRLTSVNNGDSHTQSYTFDAMGNRATKVNDGTSESYTCNAANMLLTRGTNNYTNDLDGNTLTGGGRTNTWDSQNRLYQCGNGSTTTVNTYASDGIRHRMASTTSGVTTTTDSVLDSSMFVREQKPVNGVETNVATYLIGPRGPEYRRDDSSGAIRWYCYDGLGSVLGEVNTSGTLTATRSYDVYGAVRTSAGTSTSKHKFVGSLGHPSDDETGLVYMQHRCMDPVTGRFINEDVSKHGTNWYSYCRENPVNRVDPNGCDDMDSILALLWRCFSGFLIGTYSKEQMVILIKIAIRELSQIAKFEKLIGMFEIDMAAVDAEASAFEGDAAGMGAEIATLRAAIGTTHMTYGAIAKLAIRALEVMAELVEMF